MTDIQNYAQSIVLTLAKEGFKAYYAGGWVRDHLMGHPSEDIDIATDATPSQIMDLFPQTLLVGLAFGVVIVILHGHQFEVATFRKDLNYMDGRHPQGIEISTPVEDAMRRDFTINGLFFDPLENVVYDYVNGKQDIQKGIIRAIGNPYERFQEDRLRILRAFRFAARFGFIIDPETQEAIQENAPLLFPAVAVERVWQELTKMANSPRFDQALIEMQRLGVLEKIFPEMKGMHAQDFRHLVRHFPSFPKTTPLILYLLEILPELSLKQKNDVADRLKISNKDREWIEHMEQLQSLEKKEKESNTINLYQWVYAYAMTDWERAINILAWRNEFFDETLLQKHQQRFEQVKLHVNRVITNKPLLSGAFLQKKGIAPGKRMGLILKEAERLAIEENWNDADLLFEKLQTLPIWKEK
jgi:poly(A) polymerase